MVDNALQPLMLLAGLGLLCWVMLRGRLLRKQRNRSPTISPHLKHNSSARRQYDQFSGAHSVGAPTEVLRWQVEMHDLARQLQAELDSKMAAVRALLRQYDEASRRLRQQIERAERLNESPDRPQSLYDRIAMLDQQGWDDTKIAAYLNLPIEDVRAVTRVTRSTADR